MRVAEICSHRVICVDQDATVLEAAELMRHQDVGALVVTRNGKGKPLGIVTDRDLVTRVIAADKNPRDVSVSDIMTLSLATCRANHDLLDVLELMRTRGIRRVPVVDAQSGLIGIVTTDDVIGALAEHVMDLARSVLSEGTLEGRRNRDQSASENVKRRTASTRRQTARPAAQQ